MAHESITKTLTVTLGICIICSILVSSAAVSLHGLQEKNRKVDTIKNILQAGNLYEEGSDVLSIYNERIEPILIKVSKDEKETPDEFWTELNMEKYSIKEMARHPEYGEKIVPEKDIAGIKKRPRHMVIYLVKDGYKIDMVVLPIYGKGLWSTMYGFISLASDFKTIRGLTFYEHGETPGLGGEIDNPSWKTLWKGKTAYDDQDNTIITIIKGLVNPKNPDADHQIDGISGATLTARGVDQLVKYWLGDEGYGPYLAKMRRRTQ